MTATTTAAAASINAAFTAQQKRIERERCKLNLETYQTQGATITEMREYAHCVDVLHPKELSGADVFAIKALIVMCLVASIIGAWRGVDLEDRLLGALIWPLMAAAVWLAVLLAIVGVNFLIEG